MAGRAIKWTAATAATVAGLVLGSGCYVGQQELPGAGPPDEDGPAGDSSGEDDPSSSPEDAGIPACDPSLVPDETALRRLTRTQYHNTVADLLRWAVPAEADALLDVLAPTLATMPADERRAPQGETLGGFRRVDQTVHQQHIDAGYAVAMEVAAALVEPARLGVVVGSCAVDGDPSNDSACVDEFIERFAERTLRRPADDAELVQLRQIFDGDGATVGMDPAAFADVITALMMAPQFMYMVEHGTEPVDGLDGVYRLSNYELASRLSYHLWQTMPDDELLEAARSGALLTEDGYDAQLDRMLDDPRTRDSIAEFYREWLWADDALLGDPTFDAFVGDTPIGPDTRDNMIDELVEMAVWTTFDARGSLRDLMLSDRSFARTPDIAAIYGVEPWVDGEPPVIPDTGRAGVLTRAALLANATGSTRPIWKGVLVRKALLCDPLPPPPPEADMHVPELSEDMTTRQMVEELTSPAACVGCHAQINPLGFVSEGYDALGRSRSEEVRYGSAGEVLSQLPVDTSVVPFVASSDEPEISTPRELAELMLDSGKVHGCFARSYVRFTFARDEHLERDACVLSEIVGSLGPETPILEALRAIAASEHFKQRNFD